MSNRVFRFCRQFLVAGLIALCSLASHLTAATTAPKVSASYEVVQRTNLGAQEQIRLRIHLVNRGPAALAINRMTLWSFSQPEKGGTRPYHVVVGANSSADANLEFTIRSADYRLWRADRQPRLILQMTGPGNARAKTVVHLVHASAQGVK